MNGTTVLGDARSSVHIPLISAAAGMEYSPSRPSRVRRQQSRHYAILSDSINEV